MISKKNIFLTLILSLVSNIQLNAMNPSTGKEDSSIREHVPASIDLSGSKTTIVPKPFNPPRELSELIEKYVGPDHITPNGIKVLRNKFAHGGFYDGDSYTDEQLELAWRTLQYQNQQKQERQREERARLVQQSVVLPGKEDTSVDGVKNNIRKYLGFAQSLYGLCHEIDELKAFSNEDIQKLKTLWVAVSRPIALYIATGADKDFEKKAKEDIENRFSKCQSDKEKKDVANEVVRMTHLLELAVRNKIRMLMIDLKQGRYKKIAEQNEVIVKIINIMDPRLFSFFSEGINTQETERNTNASHKPNSLVTEKQTISKEKKSQQSVAYVVLKYNDTVLPYALVAEKVKRLESLRKKETGKDLNQDNRNAFVTLINLVCAHGKSKYEGDKKYAKILQEQGLINNNNSISPEIVVIILSRYGLSEKGCLIMRDPIKSELS